MNFISHFYLDRGQADSWFFAGVSTPDLVSVFDRNVRLKQHTLPLLMENESSPEEISFYNGVLRHFEVDRIFHSSLFFKEETRRLTELLKMQFGPGGVPRAFFVAHVAFELILDKILIQENHSLVAEFYAHLERYPLEKYVSLTEWVTRGSLPGYAQFLDRFITKKYLNRYTDLNHVIFILGRILLGVGMGEQPYMANPQFHSLLHQYEEGLRKRCFHGFAHLNEQLYQI